MNRRARLTGMAIVILWASVASQSEPLAASHPSNAAEAFRTFDLYADRTAAAGTTDHVNLSGVYPGTLVNSSYLVVHTVGSLTDTAAIIDSQPQNATGMSVTGSTPQSYAEFTVSPARLITSVGLLVNAYSVYAGLGTFDDFLKPLVTVTVTYSDATTWSTTLNVDQHVRNWNHDFITCGPDLWYTATGTPYDSLVVPLYASGGYYYDMQEVRLPRVYKSVAKVSVAAILLDHPCSTFVPHIYAGFRLHGISLWPRFSVSNRAAQAIGPQLQNDPTWADSPYGGYAFNGAPVGTWRAIKNTGCFVSCLSMLNNYFGATGTTPLSLNNWLRQQGAFSQEQLVELRTVGQTVGSTVTFKKYGKITPKVGTTFLIEHGPMNPVATVQVTVAPGKGSLGSGQIIARHQAGTLAVGDIGVVYSLPSNHRASFEFSGGKWDLGGAGSSDLTASAEAALVDSIPVMIHVRDTGGGFNHWIVASGMTPTFTSSTSAAGTYLIANPYNSVSFGASKLFESPYGNLFNDVRVPQRLGAFPSPELLPAIATHAADTPAGCVIVLNAAAHATITDPLSRTISYDPSSDSYAVGITGAVAIRGWSDAVADDPTQDAESIDVFELPSAASGAYTVSVTTEDTDDMNLSAAAYGSSGTTSSSGVSLSMLSGYTQPFSVQYDAGSATVSVNSVADVPAAQGALQLAIRARPNPTFGPSRLEFVLPRAGNAYVTVLDAQGRIVRTLVSGALAAGPHEADWDGTDDQGAPGRPGLYFVRLSLLGQSVAVRLVVLR